MSVLKQMAEIEKDSIPADEAMERYNEVVHIARQIPDTLMWIDAFERAKWCIERAWRVGGICAIVT